jgi:hypothetical protein
MFGLIGIGRDIVSPALTGRGKGYCVGGIPGFAPGAIPGGRGAQNKI